jgi:hypothetical protein
MPPNEPARAVYSKIHHMTCAGFSFCLCSPSLWRAESVLLCLNFLKLNMSPASFARR